MPLDRLALYAFTSVALCVLLLAPLPFLVGGA